MKKTQSNSTHSLSKKRGAKRAVVTSISEKRKSDTRAAGSKSADAAAMRNQASDLKALESIIRQLPDLDTARVVELHNRIVSGEYEIATRRVAAKLLELESSLDR